MTFVAVRVHRMCAADKPARTKRVCLAGAGATSAVCSTSAVTYTYHSFACLLGPSDCATAFLVHGEPHRYLRYSSSGMLLVQNSNFKCLVRPSCSGLGALSTLGLGTLLLGHSDTQQLIACTGEGVCHIFNIRPTDIR